MATTFLTLANTVIARVNEVQLTASNFSDARGIQIQCKNAVNESIRWINQKEFNWPFNHSTKTQTLTPGIASYSIPTDAKTVDYDTFRMVRDNDLGVGGDNLNILTYYEYVQRFIEDEDAVKTTALNGSHTDSVTTITVDSTSGFDSSGTIYINGEVITYTGTSSTTFTGATRGASSTTAAAHLTSAAVTYTAGAVNLTGYSVVAQIRKNYGSSTATAFAATITNATAGEIALTLTDTQTAALSDGRYQWDCKITGGSGTVTRVIEGIATINPSVSRS